MNEQDIKKILENVSNNDLQEIVKKMTNLLMDAFELGLNTGIVIAPKQFIDESNEQINEDLPVWREVTHDADFHMHANFNDYYINDEISENGSVKHRYVIKKDDIYKLPKINEQL